MYHKHNQSKCSQFWKALTTSRFFLNWEPFFSKRGGSALLLWSSRTLLMRPFSETVRLSSTIIISRSRTSQHRLESESSDSLIEISDGCWQQMCTWNHSRLWPEKAQGSFTHSRHRDNDRHVSKHRCGVEKGNVTWPEWAELMRTLLLFSVNLN